MRIFSFLSILLFALLCGSTAHTQTFSIRGSVKDTLRDKPLEHAAITLIHLPDSILSTFTRTDAAGAFALSPDTGGRFLVITTYPGFADYLQEVNVKEKDPVNMGVISMYSKAQLLNEFIFKQRTGVIKINGDTTEYVADSFKLHANASVEELLKKLPGLQVDRNGGITAQGEKVEKILVDGEEFFSDDPAVVTKNMDADAVKSVQVYDKKSDEALFTGIDDGQKTKTINLKLKEDRKKGFFGKIQAGGGADGYFENQGMINAFKGKRQISAFGIVANTGKIGLGWEDRDKYGSGNNHEFDEESGAMYSYINNGEDDEQVGWQGTYNGEGIPTAWTGGVHYANKWKEDAQQLAGNYRYSKQNIEAVGNTITQYFLPDSTFYRTQQRSSFSSGERHRADARYEWKIDTTSNLKVTVDGGYTSTLNNSAFHTETLGGNDALINTSNRWLNTTGTSQTLNSSLVYRKKFKKKGRNFNISLNEAYRASGNTSFLRADNAYFTDGSVSSTDSTDQRKELATQTLSINGTATYTEPLSKVAFLTASYGIGINNSRADRLTYDRQITEGYSDVPNDSFSSKYDFNVATHKGSANLRFVYKKYNFSLGTSAFFTHFGQHDLMHDTAVSRSYTNFAPVAAFNYNFSKQKRITLNYNGRTKQPTIEQLQPLRQNTDPLNIAIGNPQLKQEFNNSVYLNYNDYKVLTGLYTYAGGGVNFVEDAISRAETIDERGVRTSQYINVAGNYNAWVHGGLGGKLQKPDMQIGINANINLSHQNNIVNDMANTSNNNKYGGSFSISKEWKKKDKTIAEITLEPGIAYNDSRASISTNTTSYWSSESEASASVELPWKLRLSTSLWINLRQRNGVFDRNNNVVRWDAYCARKLGKKDKAELRISAFDILNQNIGYNRFGTDNYVSENSYNTIRRYGLLSFVWNFAKMPGGMKAPGSDDDD